MNNNFNFFDTNLTRKSQDREKKFESQKSLPAGFLKYGEAYFDGSPENPGYGGYRYDGRYAASVQKIISFYNLKTDNFIYEIGCAKGFILYEFYKQGFRRLGGIDLSQYAVENSPAEVRDFLRIGSAENLPVEDGSVDFLYSKEVFPHLTEFQLHQTISEIKRITSKSSKIFFEIQVADSQEKVEKTMKWDPTHQTLRSAEWWVNLFHENALQVDINFKDLF